MPVPCPKKSDFYCFLSNFRDIYSGVYVIINHIRRGMIYFLHILLIKKENEMKTTKQEKKNRKRKTERTESVLAV